MSREEIEGLVWALREREAQFSANQRYATARALGGAAQALTALLAENERLREAAREGLLCAEADLEERRNECLEHGDDPETDATFKLFKWRRDLIAAALPPSRPPGRGEMFPENLPKPMSAAEKATTPWDFWRFPDRHSGENLAAMCAEGLARVRAGEFDAVSFDLFNEHETAFVKTWMQEHAPDVRYSARCLVFPAAREGNNA